MRMKKEPTEPGLGTKKAPEDMEGVKKAALDEQNCSQEKNRSWEEAMKIEQIQVRQKISSQQKNVAQEVTGQQESSGQKALQEAVQHLELGEELIALQMELEEH